MTPAIVKPTILAIFLKPNESKILREIDDVNFIYAGQEPDGDIDKNYINSYVESCCRILESKKIDGILYCNDTASILAGYLCDRFSLPGPTLESVFLCLNKYYSREKDGSDIWYLGIDIDSNLDELKDSLQFPFFLKPANLYNSLYQNRIYNYDQLVEIIDTFKEQHLLSQKNSHFSDLFAKNLPPSKYPYANKNLLLAEEVIQDARQFTVEGWSDSAGNPYIWAVADNTYDATGITLDNYLVPTQATSKVRDKLCESALRIIANYEIVNGFWDIEIWLRNGDVIVTEVNGRLAPTFEELYLEVYGKSLYKAAINLSMGNEDYLKPLSPLYQFDNKVTAGHFYITAYGEGKVDELIDFDRLASMESLNVDFYCRKDDYVQQKSTAGTRIARITVSGITHKATLDKANAIRNSIIKQPNSFPLYA